MELLWRMGDALCNVIDITDTRVIRQNRNGELDPSYVPISQAMLPADSIIRSNLFAAARPLSVEERGLYRSIWSRLRDENTPLRVLDCGELASAQLSLSLSLSLSRARPPIGARWHGS